MTNSNGFEDSTFDLPRWQPQQPYLVNSPAAAQYASMYTQPSRTSPQVAALDDTAASQGPRLPPLNMMNLHSGQQQLPSAPARQQTRLDHLSPAQPSLGRSYSIGGSNSLQARNRRPTDDIESAYSTDAALSTHSQHHPSKSQQQQQSFYPPGITYAQSGHQQFTPSSAMAPSMSQQDQYMPDSTYDPSPHQVHQHSSRDSQQSNSSRKTDSFGNASSIFPGTTPFGSSSSYAASNAHPATESNSKPSTPFLSPHQQALSSTSPYSPSAYTQPLDHAQVTPSSRRHQQSASQSQLSQHLSPQQNPYQISSMSHSSSPVSYQQQQQPRAHGQYYSPPIKDEPMQDVIRPGSSSQLGYDIYGNVQSASRQPSPMDQLTPRQRRLQGFRPVKESRDLRPTFNPNPTGRRADPLKPGGFLNPLLCLTTNIAPTYGLCNHTFRYESSHNPRRVLTKPSKPAHNDGFDNEDYDYILYVNDWLGPENGSKYLILDILGQGTFGQVVKCQNMKTHEIVAVKVVKNKPAYFNQSMMEVTILEMLNKQHDPKDEHHILRMLDSFVHKNHLCLVFELLSQNLYELIKQNQFQGLSTQLVKVFTAQLLDALCVLKEAHLIHCDLKPENILLKSLSSPGIKVIDFGSACHERQTVYTYIQSRFYRSPEVLLGLSYNSAIDMWSLGCIAVELFLGLPLFPGSSEYNQITRIVEMLGLPPAHMLEHGKQTSQFFDSYQDGYNQKQHKLKSIEQYSREHNTQEQPGKQYFKATTLPEIVEIAPMPPSRHSASGKLSKAEMEREQNNRAAFIDFCLGLLNMNPMERWTPHQARRHPFITGEKFTKRWQPYASITEIPAPSPALVPPTPDPRRPYGGLVQSQPKGSRAYQDAAAYNQQLNQHQTYTAQQQAAQATSQAYRNPYVAPPSAQQPQQQPQMYSNRSDKDDFDNNQGLIQQQQMRPPQTQSQFGPSLHPNNQGSGAPMTVSYNNQQSAGSSLNNPNPPSSSYYPNPNARTRANTINQMDTVPPALARLTQMNKDLSGIGRNTLTPIINRAEDPHQQWERRAQGKAPPPQSYPQLEYLQQQAEMTAPGGWQHSGGSGASRYPPPVNMMQYQSPVQLVVDNQERRRNRASQRPDYGTGLPAPPQSSYSGADGNLSNLYVPMQPNQYGTLPSSIAGQTQPSLYGSSVVPPGQQQQNPATYGQKSYQSASGSRDSRRSSGIELDSWNQGS